MNNILRQGEEVAYLIDRNFLNTFIPKRLLVDGPSLAEFMHATDHPYAGAIQGGCRRLHCACTTRLGLFRVLVHESIEEM